MNWLAAIRGLDILPTINCFVCNTACNRKTCIVNINYKRSIELWFHLSPDPEGVKMSKAFVQQFMELSELLGWTQERRDDMKKLCRIDPIGAKLFIPLMLRRCKEIGNRVNMTYDNVFRKP